MIELKVLFRNYEDASDYKSCEALVNDAWKFDSNFKPPELANIVKTMYTKGSVIGSNYLRVVEVNGQVIGFIFGQNEKYSKRKKGVLFGLGIMLRIICLRGMEFKEKKRLFIATNIHEINRLKLIGKARSEISLFVIDEKFQGFGYGKRLLADFIINCKEYGENSIVVETNKFGASGFYEGIGFIHKGNFESPLYGYTADNWQACIYEYEV